jgi:hypothetical protein
MSISSPLSFEKERGRGELREGCGGRRSRYCLVANYNKEIDITRVASND